MPITSIPIPSSVSPITTLKDFIDKGREDMLSFLAAIKGTYIYWTVFPTNDPLTLKQAEEERRVAEMVDQIDCARIDLHLSAPSLSLPVHVAESVVLVLVKIRQVLTDSVAASVQGIMSRTDCVVFASEE